MTLTQQQLDSLKELISVELLKRGFRVELTLTETSLKNGTPKLELRSTEFQTTPVIFKTLSIYDFGSSVKKRLHKEIYGGDKDVEIFEIGISVHIGWEHFEGGTNMSNLFYVYGVFFPDREDIYSVKIR